MVELLCEAVPFSIFFGMEREDFYRHCTRGIEAFRVAPLIQEQKQEMKVTD